MAGQHPDEFTELERQLAAIEPQASRLDRADLLFRAGQESVRVLHAEPTSRRWMWQLSTALLAVVALGLSWRLYNTPPETIERIRYVQVPSEKSLPMESTPAEEPPRIVQPTNDTALARNHYLQQRRLAVGMGLDALGDPWSGNHAVPSSLTSYRDLKVEDFYPDESSSGDASPSAPNQKL